MTGGADIPDATVIVEAASTEKSGTDAAQLETALIVATTVVGLEQATMSDPAVDATPLADDPLPASTPASPAPALAHELRDLSNGRAVAAAARNIGDVASADAPGQSKPDGQKNAVGRGEEQASRPVPRPEADPTSNRDRSPVEPVAIAAAIAGRTQAATADSSDQSSEGDNVHALTGIGQPPRANGLTLANAATPANRGLPTHLPVPEQLAVHIQRAARDGLDRIDIRLSPAELGRIEVRLEFGHDGRLTASIAADRPETLDQLQRDARGLERALEAAGLKTDAGGLSFNLRGDNRQDAQNNQRLTQTGSATLLLDTALPEDASSAALASTARPNGLLDIRV
jgi:flagellar hook-length control protein FliK